MIKLTKVILCLLLFPQILWAMTLKEMPVQDGGRIKPFDTLASESVRLIYGKENYKGKEPVVLALTWLLAPETWAQTEFIQIKNRKLKEALSLDTKKDFFSQKQLGTNPNIEALFLNLEVKNKKKVKLNAFDQALNRLQGQLFRLSMFQSGDILRIQPQPDNKAWKNVNNFDPVYQKEFADLLKSMTTAIQDENYQQAFDSKSEALNKLIYSEYTGDKDSLRLKLKSEIFYNDYHPFRYAWIVYLLALIFMFIYWLKPLKSLVYVFAGFMGLGFLLHTLGFILRVYISGRPPVSNMYETVLWVPFGTIIFGLIIGKWGKSLLPYVGSCVVAIICLIVADMAPVMLDPSIQPLEAVLKSNFWLMVHVLTIVISYSAFFLAFILGDFSLFYHLKEDHYKTQIKEVTQAIYRSLQIGIFLLAVGTVLGGVWADYSWGRFWGWDPKETWAFIALMGYLALLHARLVGMVKSFGMAAGSVLAFSLVIMAWYGVNFWLGAGLHSYGFGSGGVEYVSIFVAIHILFVFYVGIYRNLKAKEA